MATKPRNPRYFPKMKVRGARRRRMAGTQRFSGTLDRSAIAAVTSGEQFAAFVRLVVDTEEKS